MTVAQQALKAAFPERRMALKRVSQDLQMARDSMRRLEETVIGTQQEMSDLQAAWIALGGKVEDLT